MFWRDSSERTFFNAVLIWLLALVLHTRDTLDAFIEVVLVADTLGGPCTLFFESGFDVFGLPVEDRLVYVDRGHTPRIMQMRECWLLCSAG